VCAFSFYFSECAKFLIFYKKRVIRFNTGAVNFQLQEYKFLWYSGLIMYQPFMRSVGSNGETALVKPTVPITTFYIINPASTGIEPKAPL